MVEKRPLLILVGLTGTGKTTTINALRGAGLDFTLLPNRRQLTDDLIIRHVQTANNEPLQPITDRICRFAYTRRYREMYPGGMAHALNRYLMNGHQLSVIGNQLSVTGNQSPATEYRPPITDHRLLLFDGLRGENEITHAIQHLPQAKFLFLHAPDEVRVNRLLKRGDAFDRVENADELEAKRTIVQAERRNYDPDATMNALQTLAPKRLIFADTTYHSPHAIAQQVMSHVFGSKI